MSEIKPNKILDVRGLFCPEPVLKTKKAMDTMRVGEVLEIVGTDPGSKADLPAWAKRAGHEFLELKEEKEANRYYIRKKK